MPYKFSILISTFKRDDILKKTLDSYLNFEGDDFEVIVGDNACNSSTQKLVESYQGRLSIRYYPEPQKGKSAVLNSIMPLAKGEYFLFADDDVVADRNLLKEYSKGISRWPENKVFGGKILPQWASIKNLDFILRIRPDRIVGFYALADWNFPEGLCENKYFFGSNYCVHSSVYLSGFRFNIDMGPKAGEIYLNGEETDFLMRIQTAGFNGVYLPKAVVYHQIRDEQMTWKWLKFRAYLSGKTLVHNDDTRPHRKIFNISTYLFRHIVLISWGWLKGLLTFNVYEQFKWKVEFWHIMGALVQNRKMNLALKKGPQHA